MKIAVVGLGAIGSQVLWQLSKRSGLEVHGFDTHFPGHPQAGAGGESRLFWNLEVSEPEYSALIVRAARAWRQLEDEFESPLRRSTGVLIFGEQGSPQFSRAQASAILTGAEIEDLPHEELVRRFPHFAFKEQDIGIWDVDGAVIRPEFTIATVTALAEANGAFVHRFSRVHSVQVKNGGGGVITSNEGSESFDRIVVAAGGWTPQLLPYLKDEVVARRLTSAWYFADEPHALEGYPPFLQTAPGYCYGIPTSDGLAVKLGLGFNDHLATGDPDSLVRHLEGEDLEEQVARFSRLREGLFPKLSPRPYRVSTYVESYTRSMMEHLRFHPESSDILVLTGFSGHGFRVAPAIGEIGTEMILDGRSTIDIDFLSHAEPVFSIVDPRTGEASHNPVMSSYGAS